MSYIVPGKLPTSCCGCHMFVHEEHDLYCTANHYAGYCKELGKFINEDTFVNEMHPDCPLIEIQPHVRLIDANAHILKIRKWYCEDCSRRKGIKNGKMQFCYEIGGVVCRACEIEDMLNALEDAPTVIESEGET